MSGVGTAALAGAAAGAAVLLVMGPTPANARLARIMRPTAAFRFSLGHVEPGGRPAGAAPAPRGRLAAAWLAGLACLLTVGGVVGLLAGVAIGYGTWQGLGRLEPAWRRQEREQVEAQLPLAADLLAAVVAAGCPPEKAVEYVGGALGGALGRSFVTAASSARLAPDAAQSWSALTDVPALAPLARALSSAVSRGTSPVPALERAADDARHRARWSAESRSRALGARAAAPLGLCFLPAFVLVGIVPIIASSGLIPN